MLRRAARGWSGIRAAADTEIEISAGRLIVTKQRDLEIIEPIKFRLERVDRRRKNIDPLRKEESRCNSTPRADQSYDTMAPALGPAIALP